MKPTPKSARSHYPTRHKLNRNWNRRYQDGKHKPKDKK